MWFLSRLRINHYTQCEIFRADVTLKHFNKNEQETTVLQMLLAVFIGGGTGSVVRWLLSMRLNPVHAALPIGTLTANLVGAFIIGLGLALFTRMTHLDPVWKLLITTGFCGGLTTFSTFSAEVVFLLQDGRLAWAALNILLNLAGSLTMTALAFWIVSLAYGQ